MFSIVSPARAAAAALAVLLAACQPAPPPGEPFVYEFSAPPPGPGAGRARIRTIDAALRGPSCGSIANRPVCARYAMESGLIYALVERQEIESENMLRRALDFDATCDLRLLTATAAAKRARQRGELSEAAALLAGEGGRCDSTVSRYYEAKLNILSDDAERIAAGRAQLAELSGYSLGNSGIAPKDLYDLGVYSFVEAGEFEAAEGRVREAIDAGVAVSPKLQALVLVGRGGAGRFVVAPGARAEARGYIDRRLADYDFGRAIREFAAQASRMESVRAVPWERVEERLAADPNLTQSQRNIVRIRLEDEFARLGAEIDRIDEARAALEAYGGGLADAERALAQAAVAQAFGDGAAGLEEARAAYLAALRRVARSLEEIDSAVGDMGAMQDLYDLLADPEAYVRMADAAAELGAAAERLAADDADAAVLRAFAAAVSRGISPEEFFRAYSVGLDQLGFGSEDVAANVRRTMELAGAGEV